MVDLVSLLSGQTAVVTGAAQGLGFAIPSNLVRYIYEQLRKQGRVHRSVIGVVLQDITPDLASGLRLKKHEGVIVSDVVPDGPAETASWPYPS